MWAGDDADEDGGVVENDDSDRGGRARGCEMVVVDHDDGD